MKKHWQIKPWIMIVIAVVLLGAILFVIGLFKAQNHVASYYGDGYMMESTSLAPSEYSAKVAAPMMARDESFPVNDSVAQAPAQDRMIIKTGSLSMVVASVVDTAKVITDYTEKNGGFIINTSVDKSSLELYGSVSVRVPSKSFAEAVTYIKTLGEVQSENVSGQDITEEYTDLDGQLKNLKATEEQFQAIMKDAYKIEDVLAVQRELMNVRGQIESITGRMKYLKESVDMSSLTVYLSTDPSKLPVVDDGNTWKPFAILKDAFRSLLATGQTIVNGIIWVVVYIPAIAVLGLIVWGIRRFFKRKK